MREEEIIKGIEQDITKFNELLKFGNENLYHWINVDEVREKIATYQGLLDLYQKEKEKNKELEEKLDIEKYTNRLKSVKIFKFEKNYISKAKIEEKIEELESIYKQEVNQKYNGNYYQQLKYAIQVLQEL